MSLLVRAALIATGTGAELEGGWVLCHDGVISAVGSGPPPSADDRLDLPGSVAMPGLVNGNRRAGHQDLPGASQLVEGEDTWRRDRR